MGSLQDTTRKYRQAVAANDAVASKTLARHYQAIYGRLESQASALADKLEQVIAQGLEPDRAWLYQEERFQVLLQQTQDEIDKLARAVRPTLERQRSSAVRLGAKFGHQQMLALTASEVGLNTAAVEQMVGAVQAGSPLEGLLGKLGEQAAQEVASRLVVAVGTGANPRAVAPSLRSALDGNLSRARTIARTEIVRASRTGALDSYTRDPTGVITGWIWMSALDDTTCAACWAHHGEVHSLDEQLDDHPNGRCTTVPATKSYGEILGGVPDPTATPPGFPSRDEAWSRLDGEAQRAILGPTRLEGLDKGTIGWSDLSANRTSSAWGDSVRVPTLGELGLKQAGG